MMCTNRNKKQKMTISLYTTYILKNARINTKKMYLFGDFNVGILNDYKYCCYFAGIHFLLLITKPCCVYLRVITTGEKQKVQGKTFCVLGVRKRMEKRIKSKRPGTAGGYSFPYSGDCCVYRGTLSLLLSPAAEQTGHLRTNIEHSESNSHAGSG